MCFSRHCFLPLKRLKKKCLQRQWIGGGRWARGRGEGKLKGVKKLTPILHFQLSYPHCACCPVEWQDLLYRALFSLSSETLRLFTGERKEIRQLIGFYKRSDVKLESCYYFVPKFLTNDC